MENIEEQKKYNEEENIEGIENLSNKGCMKKVKVIERNVKMSEIEKLEALKKLLSKYEKSYSNYDIDIIGESSKFTSIILLVFSTVPGKMVLDAITSSEGFNNLSEVGKFFAGAGSVLAGAIATVLALIAGCLALLPGHYIIQRLCDKKCDSLNDIIVELKEIIKEKQKMINEQENQKQ